MCMSQRVSQNCDRRCQNGAKLAHVSRHETVPCFHFKNKSFRKTFLGIRKTTFDNFFAAMNTEKTNCIFSVFTMRKIYNSTRNRITRSNKRLMRETDEPAVFSDGKMADDQERFEAEIDLDVSFNEFDEELDEFQQENCIAHTETTITNNNRKDSKQCELHACELTVKEPNITNGNYTENVGNLAKTEDGEISESSEGEKDEKMDCDEVIGVNLNSIQKKTKPAEDSNETVTSSFTFLPPSKESSNEEFLDEAFMRDATKCVETESVNLSMESDNSMDDQSWKRRKRAKLEHGSQETGTYKEKKGYGKGKENKL